MVDFFFILGDIMLEEFRVYKIYVFTGHFGSGKTETAVNFALKLRDFHKKINIVDMDIVNPFFRTVDFRFELEDNGINVIASRYAGTNIESPALPREILPALNENGSRTILDVGGDDIGARVLSGYREHILGFPNRVYCVVNIRRPETNTPEKIIKTIRQIEESSGIKISALVNNTNLSSETQAEDVVEGQNILREVSKKKGIPIAFICADEKVIKGLPSVLRQSSLTHKVRITLPWE